MTFRARQNSKKLLLSNSTTIATDTNMQQSLFMIIPRELLWSILNMVDERDLFLIVPLVCREWNSIVSDVMFWKNKIKQKGRLDADWTIDNVSWRKQYWTALFDRKELSFDELTAKNSPDGRPDPTEDLVTQRKKVLYRQEPTLSISRSEDWTVRFYNNIFKYSVTTSALNNYDTNAYYVGNSMGEIIRMKSDALCDRRVFPIHSQKINSMQFLWDYNNATLGRPLHSFGNALITSSDDGDIRISYIKDDVYRSNFFERPYDTPVAVLRTTILPTSVGTVSAYNTGSLVYHDMNTGLVTMKTNSLVTGPKENIMNLRVHHDGKLASFTSSANPTKLQLFQVTDNQILTNTVYPDPIVDCSYSINGYYMYVMTTKSFYQLDLRKLSNTASHTLHHEVRDMGHVARDDSSLVVAYSCDNHIQLVTRSNSYLLEEKNRFALPSDTPLTSLFIDKFSQRLVATTRSGLLVVS